MERNTIVAGTGFNNPDGSDRAALIRRHCNERSRFELRREPNNPHDANAVGVYMAIPGFLGLGRRMVQIGHLKAPFAARIAPKMDAGTKVAATLASYYAPDEMNFPRVSLTISW